MNWFKDRFRDELWFDDWSPMKQSEIDMTRMKAYLDWAEQEQVEDLEPPYETYNYKNKAGKLMTCRILIRRKNGEIIVRNQNGVNVCLTENDLF
jgi:hypothetical protein